MSKVMLIEDSETIREAIESYLILNDYDVASCGTLTEAQSILQQETPNLVVIDVNLPDGNGFLFVRDMLEKMTAPFLFLTSRDNESDRITGLELGAADYIVKPFSLKELILRITAILRRSSPPIQGAIGTPYWKLGNDILKTNLKSHKVELNNMALSLTPTEWEILNNLLSHDGAILSREQIQKSLWYITEEKSLKTIDSHIKNIRHKLGNPDWIEAVRGFGFRFNGTKYA